MAAGAAVAGFACSSFSGGPLSRPEPDAAPRVEATGDAGSSPFCPSRPEAGLCSDFDDGSPVSFHFLEAVGDVALDHSLFRSPPASMRAVAVGSSAYLRGEASGEPFKSKQRLSYDTYQGSSNGTTDDAGAAWASIVSRVRQGTNGCAFDIESFVSKARMNVATPLDDGGTIYENFELAGYPPAGRWTHIDVLIDAEAGQAFVAVLINGFEALKRRATKCPALAGDPIIEVGVMDYYNRPSFAGEAYFDNVVFE
jgi:hypothetical protein